MHSFIITMITKSSDITCALWLYDYLLILRWGRTKTKTASIIRPTSPGGGDTDTVTRDTKSSMKLRKRECMND